MATEPRVLTDVQFRQQMKDLYIKVCLASSSPLVSRLRRMLILKQDSLIDAAIEHLAVSIIHQKLEEVFFY